MIMYTGLAMDILYELDIAFHNQKHANNDKNDLQNIIHTLFYIIKYNNDNRSKSHNIDEMLYDFRVGTDKPKFGPGPPFDPSKIGPISELDLRSVRKRALDVMRDNSKSNEQPRSIVATTIIDQNTYTNIVMCIIAACNIAKISNEEREKCLDGSIGFRLLLNRSDCVSWRDKVSKRIRKSMEDLLLEGSEKERKSLMLNNKNRTKEKKTITKLANSKSKLKYKKNLSKTCCACKRTGTLHPNIKFRSVPRSQQKYDALLNDKKKLIYAKKIKQREIILDRLGIIGERRKCTDLRFCDIHEYVHEYFVVDWIDSKGKERKKRFKLQVVKQYNDSEFQVDCRNYITNNNNNNNYHLHRDKSFKGIILINEGLVVKVHHHYDRASNDERNNVSTKYTKEDRKHRKAVIRTKSENDTDDDDVVDDDSDDDLSYDGSNDYEMLDDHLLTYDNNINNNVINNTEQENNNTNNNNGLDDELFFDHNMTDHLPVKKKR